MTAKKAFRVVKPEIRVLGVDDGQFKPYTKGNVLVVGVVFRGGVSIDGVMHTEVAIDGLDATDKLTAMINGSPHRRQLRLVMLNGVTLAGFNLVNLPKLYADTGLPVIALTQVKPDLDDIRSALTHLPDSEVRWRIIQNAGEIHEVTNRGSRLYMGLAGIGLSEALIVLDSTTVRGSLPEPLRVAHLIASGVTQMTP